MEITETSGERFDLAIEQFGGGASLAYEGVVLAITNGCLVVWSFSEHVHAQNATPSEAVEKIQRSKQVLEALLSNSATFAAIASKLPRRYEFCYDYGKGAVMLAREEAGTVKWVGTPSSS